MIRFKAFGDRQLEKQTASNGLHLFAQDEIPVRSQLEVVDGELIAVRHNPTPVGLAVLWEIEGFGKVLLQTTRLPERQQPYNLNVELARGKLLRISQKREEWGLMDLNLTVEQQEKIELALDRFIAALSNLDEPEKAAKLADEAIVYASDVGEEMAQSHSQLFLERRNTTQGFGRHSFGCSIDTKRMRDTQYLKYLKETFHFVTIPVSWTQIEPKEQEKDFAVLDECVNWLSRNRIAMKVGPLLNFSPASVPDWLYIWENDFEQVREMAYDYITEVVERYGNKVQAWDVISGMNGDNCFKFSFEQIIEMTRSATLAAKRAAHRSLVLVELTEPWGEYYAYNQRTIPPLIYADMVCQNGVHLDGFGVKMRFGRGAAGMRIRDMLELSSLLDKFGSFGKPIHLASVQVPSCADARDDNGKIGQAGYWHGPWSEQTQADWLLQAYKIALSKPYVETVSWQDLMDTEDGILQHGGLLRSDYTPKPVYQQLKQLKQKLVRSEKTRADKPVSPQ